MRAVTKLLTGSADAAAPVPPVLELASAGSVFVTDTSHRVVYVNRSAAALASSPADEILGRGCREVFRCLNCPPTCPLGSGAAMPGREVVLRGHAGGEVHFLKNVEALVDDSGALVGGLETMHDLSRLRHGATAGRTVEPATVVRLRGAVSHGMVGSSAPMRALLERIERLARVDATVLVTGESGTGKELVCRALHDAGPRAGRPFHAINCAALPEGLLESELFGHERGAFTGAVRDKPGRFEICEDGTVLLDEIGCLPYALQAKLLRVLEDGGFERVGGTRTRRLRARVIAATNTELDALVRQGSFRADLLYRLKVCSLRVPPLRERADDVPALVGHFAEMLAAACGARTAGFTADAISALRAYPWPGNVRELRNVVHAALVVALDQQIDCDHLPEEITGRLEGTLDAARIEEALARSRFNRSDAAAILGVSRTTLWRHMKRTGVR
ncbi:MAG TPA: sigma 54-interacting transcriptional regulator [Anaeromyxobacteraceae bacterium]|nr:sigma 54-interacting transcriptional regulator [Anaeromyxobacteraceae bacterium]